jgi:tetratricopeptide (TPR) repeat protein
MKLNGFDSPANITLDHSRYAAALVELGDVAGYEQYRMAALAGFAQTNDVVDAERIMKLVLLLPADQQIVQSVRPLFAVATAANQKSGSHGSWNSPWACMSCALVEYRRADYAKAIEWSRQDLTFGPSFGDGPRNATSRVILAMSMHQLHRDDQAAAQLARARARIDSEFGGAIVVRGDGFWFDWVIARILLREADRLIPPTTMPAPSPPDLDGFEESLGIERLQNLRARLEKNLQSQPNDAKACNQLAWALAATPYEKLRDSKRAVELAKKAVELAPRDGSIWNTLGVAEYRADNWQASVEALSKSMELRQGGDAFDWLFLSMAHWQLGHRDQARTWYEKGMAWMNTNRSKDEELLRFRAEATQLLGVPQTQPATAPANATHPTTATQPLR